MELAELRHAVMRHVIQPAFRDFPLDAETEILINPSGRFVEGGFEADTGLTGRKLMVDTYGGLAPHGGGALSGKDGTKVDRSGAYMARYIAKNIVAAGTGRSAARSVWPMPSARRSRSWWRWMPTAPASLRDDCTGAGCSRAVRPDAERHDRRAGAGQAHFPPVLQLRALHPCGSARGSSTDMAEALECACRAKEAGSVAALKHIAVLFLW